MWCRVNLRKLLCVMGIASVVQPALSHAWEGDRHDHYYRYHDHPRYGMRVNFIAHGYVPVAASGASYYYYDGLYYVLTPEGYVLVAPPIGAIVPGIPPEYRPVIINGTPYFTDNGVYYVRIRHGYQVVPEPIVQRISQPVVVQSVVRTVPVAEEHQNQTKLAEGAALGGVLGAITGGIIGHQEKGHHELGGALLGGLAGATLGGVMGSQIPNENASVPVAVVQQPAAVVVAPPPVVPAAPVADESFTVNVPDGKGGYVPVVLRKSGNGFIGPQGEYYQEFPKVSQLQVMYSK